MKKGQVTIFIIIALVIVVAIGIYFLAVEKSGIDLDRGVERIENSDSLLSLCLEDIVGEKIQEISSQGGYFETPFSRTFKFTDEDESYDLAFLCYTREFYKPCVTQQSTIISHLENDSCHKKLKVKKVMDYISLKCAHHFQSQNC